MVFPRTPSRRAAQSSKRVQKATFPPNVGGLNAFDALTNMPLTDALILFNFLPTPYGLELRKGYVEWATGTGAEVRTVLPFEGQLADNSADRLFAVTAAGIYGVTANGEISPTQVADFYDPEPDPVPEQAGRGVYTHFTSDASEHYMFYADGDAGLWLYSETSDSWTRQTTTEITSGIDPEDCAFVVSHKQRIWMVPKESADAFYLGIDAIAGASTKFTFGSKFTQGGTLVGLWSWSLDGGDGVDDYLVALSRSGDVLIYRGSDPSLPDWSLVGSWNVGEVPNSRRVVTEYGGSLYILSSFGLVDLQALMQGEDLTNEITVSPARKISRLLADAVNENLAAPEWQMSQFSSDNFLTVIEPKEETYPYEQFVQNTLTKGWTKFRDAPMVCTCEWQGRMYFGTTDGKVMLYGGNLDGTNVEGDPGAARQFEVLTAYGPLGSDDMSYKNIQYVRTLIRSAGNFKINTKPVYDFSLTDKASLPGLSQTSNVAIWDTDSWNQSVWGGSPQPRDIITGDMGMGRMAAISTVGSSSGYLLLVSWQALFTQGDYI